MSPEVVLVPALCPSSPPVLWAAPVNSFAVLFVLAACPGFVCVPYSSPYSESGRTPSRSSLLLVVTCTLVAAMACRWSRSNLDDDARLPRMHTSMFKL